MRNAEPRVFLIARPAIDWYQVALYLQEIGGLGWLEKLDKGEIGLATAFMHGYLDTEGSDAQHLTEFAGKMCYRSWEPGLNPNVRKVRNDQDEYLKNILAQYHGSVLEHASFTFILHDVSRVMTHELVRHRPGAAISQESLRFVRLDQIPFWFPKWATEDTELTYRATRLLKAMEDFQLWMAEHFKLDDDKTPMHLRKSRTSFMRRFAPEGVATGMTWTANIRTLRHVIEARTAPGAEEEIRLVAGKLGEIMKAECPALFSDFRVINGHWVPEYRKV